MSLLKRLEVDFDDGPGAFRSFFFMHLHHARAREVAMELQTLIDRGAFQTIPPDLTQGPTRVATDERTNAIIIQTERGLEDPIRALIDTLDEPVNGVTEAAP